MDRQRDRRIITVHTVVWHWLVKISVYTAHRFIYFTKKTVNTSWEALLGGHCTRSMLSLAMMVLVSVAD